MGITKVRESSGHINAFDKQKIVSSLLKESKLIEKLNGHRKLTTKEANFIASDVEFFSFYHHGFGNHKTDNGVYHEKNQSLI